MNEDKIDLLLENAIPRNTKNSTKNGLNILNKYLQHRKIANSVDELMITDLPRTFELFYAEVTKNVSKPTNKKSGENSNNNNANHSPDPERYWNTSMRAMRAAINRYLKDKIQVDIISDERFTKANKIFDAVLKDNKSKGKGSIKHKEPITSEDRERLNDYFSKYMIPSAIILQQLVQFNLMFYLCRRGRENLTHMPKDTFDVSFSLLTWSILYH